MGLNNNVRLIGYSGGDPEVKTVKGEGRKMARFTLATNDFYYNEKKELQKNVTWHNMLAWGKTAELVEKLIKKGQFIAINGEIQNRSYDDKDGNRRFYSEIVIDEFMLLEKKTSE